MSRACKRLKCGNHVTFPCLYVIEFTAIQRRFEQKLERTPILIKSTYILSAILLAGWMIGCLVFHAGNEIHVLLLGAMLAILANINR